MAYAEATERAWAAGFYDGEGHCGITRRGKSDPGIRLDVNQKERALLDRFRSAVGVGHVRGPYTHGNGPTSLRFVFYAGGMDDVCVVLAAIYPWLGDKKRAQAEVAIARYRQARVRLCAECGDPFERTTTRQIYCGRRCADRLLGREHYRRTHGVIRL